MENYRYWKDGDLDIRTCVGCKISECKLTETEGGDEIWVMYATQERIEHLYNTLGQIIAHGYIRCPNCEDEWKKDTAKYRERYQTNDDAYGLIYTPTETDERNHKKYNLWRKMLDNAKTT